MNFKVGRGDIVKDYLDFVNALDFKFHFKDKEKFQDDLIKIISDIEVEGVYDADKVYGDFINLLLKHGNAIDLEENAIKAVEELKSLGQLNGS